MVTPSQMSLLKYCFLPLKYKHKRKSMFFPIQHTRFPVVHTRPQPLCINRRSVFTGLVSAHSKRGGMRSPVTGANSPHCSCPTIAYPLLAFYCYKLLLVLTVSLLTWLMPKPLLLPPEANYWCKLVQKHSFQLSLSSSRLCLAHRLCVAHRLSRPTTGASASRS